MMATRRSAVTLWWCGDATLLMQRAPSPQVERSYDYAPLALTTYLELAGAGAVCAAVRPLGRVAPLDGYAYSDDATEPSHDTTRHFDGSATAWPLGRITPLDGNAQRFNPQS